MAPITTSNGGGTVTAATIEGTLFQLSHWIELQERNSTDESKFSLQSDDTYISTCDFVLPGNITRNADGSFTLGAAIWLPAGSATFVGGTGGTIRDTHFTQYFIDAVQYAIALQFQKAKNPQGLKYLELNFDYSTMEWSGKLQMPFISVLGLSGSVSDTGTEWLL